MESKLRFRIDKDMMVMTAGSCMKFLREYINPLADEDYSITNVYEIDGNSRFYGDKHFGLAKILMDLGVGGWRYEEVPKEKPKNKRRKNSRSGKKSDKVKNGEAVPENGG